MSESESKDKMNEETLIDEHSRGFALWEKAKAKIRAVQSFLKIQNDQILGKRKNPYQESTTDNGQNIEELISKKIKDDNGDAKPQVLDNIHDHKASNNDIMEVLEEGNQALLEEPNQLVDEVDKQKNSQLNEEDKDKEEDNNKYESKEQENVNKDNDEDQNNDEDQDEDKEDEDEDEDKDKEDEDEDEDEDKEEEDEDEDKDEDKDEDEDEDKDEDENDDDDDNDNNIFNNNLFSSQSKRDEEDKLVKSESIYVTEAILDDEEEIEETISDIFKSDSQIIDKKSTDNDNGEVSKVYKSLSTKLKENISFSINEDENIITIKICSREYSIDLKKDYVKKNEKLLKIINDITDLIEQLRKKQSEKIEELKKITDHNQFTALEYYLMKTIDDIFKEERGTQHQQWQEEICCICQCDLFDNIDNYTQDDFLKQLQNSSDDDPINLAHCESHFFHKQCLKMMIQSTHIKCPVCSKIYGVMIGDQSPGTMKIYVDKYTSCEGYPNTSTITIEMRMNNTTKNGVSVPSTSRVGYLPNTEEARKILKMFKIAFKRRLLYTIGKSVTTGKDNRIIWNGVHFKTNTYGGSSNFGYPDATYFQRVTQELSLKGIYPQD